MQSVLIKHPHRRTEQAKSLSENPNGTKSSKDLLQWGDLGKVRNKTTLVVAAPLQTGLQRFASLPWAVLGTDRVQSTGILPASGDPSLILWIPRLFTDSAAWPCWIHKSHLWLLPPQCFIALMQPEHSEQAVIAVFVWQPRKWKQRWEVISWTYCSQPEADPDSEILLLDFWFPAPPQCQTEQGISFPAPHFLSLSSTALTL